jgi:hypothetical protein
MKLANSLTKPVGIALFVACGLLASFQMSPAQAPNNYNEREVKSADTLENDPKSDVWTLDFRFKDPRLIKVNVPGRGTRICWYLWYQVINRTKEPRTFYPEFELVTLDYPGVYADDMLTTVEEEIRKREDPTGYQEIKNSVTISAKQIPVSLPPDKAFPKAITGVAIWDGTAADPKARDEKTRDLSDTQRFSIFIGGLSNGWVEIDPLAKDKAKASIIRRKTLQLNFKRVGDRFHLDARDISFEPPAEWIYRATQLPQPKRKDAPMPDGKDAPMPEVKGGKQGAMLMPLPDLDTLIQPVILRGKDNGS